MIKKCYRFYIFLLIAVFLMAPQTAIKAGEELINCDIQNGSCTKKAENLSVTLDIKPKPVKAMTDLIFTVTLTEEYKGEVPYIDLGMPGMNMGQNQIQLNRLSGRKFEGKGVIVRCPSGKRIWKADVVIPEKGKVTFIFDVIY
ncbi:MAG: hypothetical protein K9L30_11860 [Desulfobacterales bacterium]|nr:hypothetical protein [Desulfobacterales bacterium]